MSFPTKKSAKRSEAIIETLAHMYTFYLFKIFKWFLRFFTGQSQVERICSSSSHHTTEMTEQLQHCLSSSTQLKTVFLSSGLLSEEEDRSKKSGDVEKIPLMVPASNNKKNKSNTLSNITTETYVINPKLYHLNHNSDRNSSNKKSAFYDAHLFHIVVHGILQAKKPSLAKQILEKTATTTTTTTTTTGDDHQLAMNDKSVPTWVHNLFQCVQQLMHVNQSVQFLTQLKDTSVVNTDTQHEKWLDQLWTKAFPQWKRTKRVTTEWQMLGFQGTDPLTDFRGMGTLGLLNLHYFLSEHTDRARTVLAESRSAALQNELDEDDRWYGFAISGINFTSDLYHQALERHTVFSRRFYSCRSNEDTIRVFNEIYVKFFLMFHEYFKSEGASVMQFNEKKKEMVQMFFS